MRSEMLGPLIHATYETALDPAGWPRVMEMVTDLLQGSCSSVVVSDLKTGDVPFAPYDPRLPEGAIAEYLSYYGAIDTIRQSGASLPLLVALTEEEFLSPRTAEVYNDFYVHWDWGHILGLYLLREGPVAATLSVYRSGRSAAFSEQDRALASRIGVHLGRAVQIHRKLAALNGDREMVVDAMDGLAIGVVFVDGNGRVLMMNRAARQMTAERDGLSSEHGELVGAGSESTIEIRGLLATAARGSVEATGTLPVRRPSGKRPYVLLASPIHTARILGSASRVIVLITDTDRQVPDAGDTLRAIYALSKSEAALAIALCEGATLKEIAFARNVSINTVHTQLGSLQRKVGANRQTEIVSVLLRGPLGSMRRE